MAGRLAQRRARRAPEHLICTPPRAAQCPKCRAKVLVCHSYGEPVQLDAAHINRQGERIALIMGLGTYQWGDTRDEKCRRRNAGMIGREWPSTAWIHADHLCGWHWDKDYRDVRVQSAPLHYSGVAPPF